MKTFKGFTDSESFTQLPDTFFHQLLKQIDDATELKVTLYFMWRIEHTAGPFRALSKMDFDVKELGLSVDEIESGLEKALLRGSLLKVKKGANVYLLLNSPRGRAGVQAIESGKWNPAVAVSASPMERPNIYKLYEENIGPLTPLIADMLQEAEGTYREEWFEEAFTIAVKNNKRNWRYVEAILKRWKEEGKNGKKDQKNSDKGSERYTDSQFSEFLSEIKSIVKTLGDPNCPYCGGVGYVRMDVPVGHEKFGKLEPCVCRANDIAEGARARLFALSNLDRLSHLGFENFNPAGNEKAKFMTLREKEGLHQAFESCEEFARLQNGWLLLEGGYGCGKTHLAAAIANDAVSRGMPTLFITVPDLLDTLRFAYADPETTFEQRFEEIRNADLLILDDFGTQNATGWAQEKLFQIINYRYINKLPTVITTNLMLDEIEGRIRSRLQDDEFVKHIRITVPDYRRPEETSNPGISMLSWPEIKEMTFESFEPRDDELGKEIVTTITVEKETGYRNRSKERIVTRKTVTQNDIKTLHAAFNAAINFAKDPKGWLVFLGESYCGKTHLAASIGHDRIFLGGQALLVDVSSLLDYLRQTFSKDSDVSFSRRIHEIRTTPLLILDDIKESQASSIWAEDKLYSVLNYRFNTHLPTVLTSTLRPEAFALNYPSLWNKLLDTSRSRIHVIDMPPYRHTAKTKKPATTKKSGHG